MNDRIVIDSRIQHGKPVIRGTRVPVARIVGGLAGGMTLDEVAQEYGVTEDDVRAALSYAAELVEEETVYPLTDYHFHHPEKMFTDPAELLEIIAGQRLMTLALVKDGEPYLVTLNYGFDSQRCCFYFHGAGEGKKLDYMAAHPRVWGQVIEDRGYVTGKCDHAYRSVHFSGEVSLLEDEGEKREALALMIRQLEPDPEPLLQRLLTHARLSKTVVGRVQVLAMTGKRNALELVY